MLYRFLVANREKILARTESPATPRFFDHLVRELERGALGLRRRSECRHGPFAMGRDALELSRRGCTVAQIAQGYDVVCRAVAQVARAAKAPLGAAELSQLYQKLDLAVAEAVAGFAQHAGEENAESAKRMGCLVHELRNSLAAATVAHAMLRKGVVGEGDSTNALLERSLARMRDVLDRSFAEMRMRRDKPAELRPTLLLRIAEEVAASASEEARAKGLALSVEVDPGLKVDADAQYLISALSNLVQNAIKYSRRGGLVRVRSRETPRRALLEVEDRCGGLPRGGSAGLFEPFTQKGADRSGLGLGLTICRKAVALHGGTLAARDLPGKGCVFSISLPKRRAAAARRRTKRFSPVRFDPVK